MCTAAAILCAVAFLAAFSVQETVSKCSWDNCPKWASATEGSIINVHLICHTHDDLGWIKTVDDYYTGAKRSLVAVGVQYIFNSVVEQLLLDPRRRFSYAETGFLTRWLEDQPAEYVEKLRKLVVESGQLELVGGGWVQPDEAGTHYYDLIDQYSLGLRILNATYGACGQPKVCWQIDPFGHSREHANIASEIGYDALFFARQHHLELEKRARDKTLEVVWSASDDLKTSILTGGFYRGTYSPPDGFCFDDLCHDDPIIDSTRLEGHNIEAKAQKFVEFVRNQTATQRHNHTMMTMGGDFQYSNAQMWFASLDKLIDYINARESTYGMRLFYSTPSCYVKAVNEVAPHLVSKSDDFFPYASSNHSYWTGYFTSRPNLKGLIRRSSALLQLARQVLEREQGLAQHHDAVTGTSKLLVAENYVKRILDGWNQAEQVINDAFGTIATSKTKGLPPSRQLFCRRINESACEPTVASQRTGGNFTVTVFNGNSQNVDTLVRLPIYAPVTPSPSGEWSEVVQNVMDCKGQAIKSHVYKSFVPSHRYHSNDSSPYELAFMATGIPPLGFKTFFVVNGTAVGALVTLTFDANGFLSSYTDRVHNRSYALSQQFLYYSGADNSNLGQASGAYIFRPNGTEAKPIVAAGVPIGLDIVKTPLFEEARQTISPWVSQVIRLISNKSYVEFDHIVGPVPINGSNSTEVVTRYSIGGMNSGGLFQTDSNGRQMMSRKRDHADSFTFEQTEPISANYYPINSRIAIADSEKAMTVLTDRSQGGSSLRDGEVEIMIHRRCVFDDGWGVEEALNDTLISRGRHWLLIDSPPSASPKSHRPLAFELFHQPVYSFSPFNSTVDSYIKNFVTVHVLKFSPLNTSLPTGVNLLTLKPLTSTTLLLRLERIYQSTEDQSLSQPISVDVAKLFASLRVVSMKELKLAANVETNEATSRHRAQQPVSGTNVQLIPQEIRTFEVEVAKD